MKCLPIDIKNALLTFKCFDSARTVIVATFNKYNLDIYTNFAHFEYMVEEETGNPDIHYVRDISQIKTDLIIGIKAINSSQLIDFCREHIDAGSYIVLTTNSSKISNYKYKYKDFLPHQLLISGYNDEKSVMYCSDFFHFSLGNYLLEEIDYDELIKANEDIFQIVRHDIKHLDADAWMKYIEILTPCEYAEDPFSIESLIVDLKNFLYGDSLDSISVKGRLAGFSVYQQILDFTDWVIARKLKSVDIRSYCFIRDRARVMTFQCTAIAKKYEHVYLNHIIDEYQNINKKAATIVRLCMKHYINKDNHILLKIRKFVIEIAQRDFINTERYLNILQSLYSE